MDKTKIIGAITRMRDRDALREIMDAATARDTVLSNKESDRRSKLMFGRFESLKKGDSVYVHALPEKIVETHRWLVGQPLTVLKVKPRNREIEVLGQHPMRINPQRRLSSNVVLTWSVLDRLKVSTTPTPEALAFVLKGGVNGG